MKEQDPTIPDPHAKAEADLHKVIDELESVRLRLEFIREYLPVPPDEALMLVGEADMDEATEIRSVVECVLNDSLYPAIRDLQVVAALWPPPGGGDKEKKEE
ncbi:MAG TPA: hypothetical protein VHC97_00770 [Thermoanaerobaculia bacterium]|jgi:hypothetical protein|nr:hypothetical protein [Thermoanaerobaculia bacterium]